MRFICFLLVLLIFCFTTPTLFTAGQKFPVNVMKNLKFKNMPQAEFLPSEVPTVVILFRSWCPASRLQISEVLELKAKNPDLIKTDQSKTPFNPIFIALDRKYGSLGDEFEIPIEPITEYAKTHHLRLDSVFLGDFTVLKDLKVLNFVKKVETTPMLLFIDKSTREIEAHRSGLTKKEAIEEILSKF